MPSMKDVEPSKLSMNSGFKFRCHKGIKCFTKCCSKINILLTPYDIVRMKKRLGMSSEEFLEKYTVMEIDEKSTLPLVRLKMLNDDEKKCPFVTPEGCTIYTDRPANCRYYPIGQGTLRKGTDKGPVNEEFYFFIKEPHCFGYQENTKWTIQTWRSDQGVDIYDEMNREWKEIQLRRNPLMEALDSNKQAQIYTACYDMERFRRFIFESRFLDIFEIEPTEVENIKTDDIALMKLGFRYSKYILLLEETMKVREDYKKQK
ncbi:MAG: YkgJ family cysteine cluster protein [Nitrospirae bacterium]|nr:YkgJ family cysteine cluster protein [Nitrospirota bacterium]